MWLIDAMTNTTVGAGSTNGMNSGGINGASPVILRSLTAFTAIGWYNACELLILIFFAFKRYRGTYFWSLLITTLSLFPYGFGMSTADALYFALS